MYGVSFAIAALNLVPYSGVGFLGVSYSCPPLFLLYLGLYANGVQGVKDSPVRCTPDGRRKKVGRESFLSR